MIKATTLTVALTSCLVAAPVSAQMRQTVLETHELSDNVFMVTGGPANTGFVVGTDGVIVVDPQMTPADAAQALERISEVTDLPVTSVIVTHSDPDHVGGLPGYPGSPQIIAQENVRAVIERSAAAQGGPEFLIGLYRDVLDHMPTHLVAGREVMQLAGQDVDLIHTGMAHGGSDLLIHFPDHRTVFAGDILVYEGPFPVIHHGGSSLGWIEMARTMLALDADTFVPGHGELRPRAEVEALVKAVEERRAAVADMVAEGATLDAVMQALPDERADPRFPAFTEVVYGELTEGYPPAEAPWEQLAQGDGH